MKEIILTIIMAVLTLFSFAQNGNSDKTFFCESFTTDLSKYNKITSEYKNKGNKKWSVEVLRSFPLDGNNAIHYKYVISYSDSTITQQYIFKKAVIWTNQNFDVTHGATINADTSKNVIIANGQWGQVGQHYGLGATTIHAPMKMRISVQDGAITAEVKVEHYRMGAFNLYNNKGVESGLVPINTVYPSNQKSEHKESYAMAFINCNANSFNTIHSFISFLNKRDVDMNADW